jgi:hypothetical protein
MDGEDIIMEKYEKYLINEVSGDQNGMVEIMKSSGYVIYLWDDKKGNSIICKFRKKDWDKMVDLSLQIDSGTTSKTPATGNVIGFNR